MIQAWRLVLRRHLATAMTGEGARRHGGRWNAPGRAVVYAASSLSLAVLELVVHAHDTLLPRLDFVFLQLAFPEDMVEALDERTLPEDWRRPEHPGLKALGGEWLSSGRSVVWAVPSAVLPLERNFLFNPAHVDFARVRIGDPQALELDGRLVDRRA